MNQIIKNNIISVIFLIISNIIYTILLLIFVDEGLGGLGQLFFFILIILPIVLILTLICFEFYIIKKIKKNITTIDKFKYILKSNILIIIFVIIILLMW